MTPLMLKLLGRRVLVERLEQASLTQSGLELPSAARELPSIGKIICIGEKADRSLRVGEEVIFPKYHDRFVYLNDKQYLIFEDRELIAAIRSS